MDHIVKAMAYDKKVRIYAAISTDTVNEAIKAHGLNLLSAMALGRLLTVTGIMSTMTKSESVAVQIKTDAPMKGLIAISDKKGVVKGYVYNNDYTTYGQDVTGLGQLLKPGSLIVSRDFYMKEPYTGIIPLASGEIAEDIAKYYLDSEQIPTACALGTYFDESGRLVASGGYIVQAMPGTDEKTLRELEQRVSLTDNISKLIYDLETPENLINFLFSDRNVEITGTEKLMFECSCSRQSILEKLLVLDKKQLAELASEQPVIEAVCPYCSTRYHYDRNEIIDIIEKAENEER